MPGTCFFIWETSPNQSPISNKMMYRKFLAQKPVGMGPVAGGPLCIFHLQQITQVPFYEQDPTVTLTSLIKAWGALLLNP